MKEAEVGNQKICLEIRTGCYQDILILDKGIGKSRALDEIAVVTVGKV